MLFKYFKNSINGRFNNSTYDWEVVRHLNFSINSSIHSAVILRMSIRTAEAGSGSKWLSCCNSTRAIGTFKIIPLRLCIWKQI